MNPLRETRVWAVAALAGATLLVAASGGCSSLDGGSEECLNYACINAATLKGSVAVADATTSVEVRYCGTSGCVEGTLELAPPGETACTGGASARFEDGVCLTATIDILKAIAAGNGPDRAILALGYAGWSPGQLESEIQANGWLNCPADPDLIFDKNLEAKYAKALAKLGIDPSHLVSDAGHA